VDIAAWLHVVEQIVARTDGVPLFIEELTKTVLESDLLADAGDRYELSGPLPPLAIPTTLHDSLMARLDRLSPVKEVAQTAAVIGREFSHELVAAVSPLSAANLSSALDQLVASELVFRRSASRGYLQLQARAGPGRGVPVAPQVEAPATARPHRRGA
jgi:predicted ATPase